MLVSRVILIDGGGVYYHIFVFPQCILWGLTHRRCSVSMCWFSEAKMKLGDEERCQLVETWLTILHSQLPSDCIKTGIFVRLTCCWKLLLHCPLKLWALCKQVCLWVCLPCSNICWVLSVYRPMNTRRGHWVPSFYQI